MSLEVVVSGMGVLSPIGIGVEAFTESLRIGRSNFSVVEQQHEDTTFKYPAALIPDFNYKERISELQLGEVLEKKTKRTRNLSTSAQHAICVALEAWKNAGLFGVENLRERTAIVVGGSNIQLANLQAIKEKYRHKLSFLNPTYGFGFMDTDIVGVISELLKIGGEGHTIGAASASGNMAIIQGVRLVANGEYDLVLVVAPSMELSIFEYQGLTALGAMAVLQEGKSINDLCNPFDKEHSGFVYGQNAGALVIESRTHAQERTAKVFGSVAGYGLKMDGNRNPNPTANGEAQAMKRALSKSGLGISDIGYINTHGTASPLGDRAEIQAVMSIGGHGKKANATKALTGHGLSAAGLIEAITCFIQMQHGFLHPNSNLKWPISDALDWVREVNTTMELKHCMSNSFGFGGINTSLVFSN